MFPKGYKDFPPQSQDEVTDKIILARIEHINYLVEEEIMPIIFGRVYQDGYNLGKDECQNSTILLVEAFKNAMYKSVGMEHPLSEISDNMIFADVSEVSITPKDATILDNDKDDKVDIT